MLVSAPGIALRTLIREASNSAVRELIGENTIEILEELEPGITVDKNFGDFAADLVDPQRLFSDVKKLNLIIRMLPLPKARELGERLGVSSNRTLYDDLCLVASDRRSLKTLNSFFGVVRERRAPLDLTSAEQEVEPKYGLFDHQRSVVERAHKALLNVPRKVILHMPTGSGKTRTAMHIVAEHLRKIEPTVVCWLAHSSELLEQAAEEFDTAWQNLGNRKVNVVRFWGGRRVKPIETSDGLIVAGLNKFSNYDRKHPDEVLRLADRTSLTVIDEAHQAIAPTYASTLLALSTKRPKNALMGLTATPGRTWDDIEEDRKLSDFFDGQKVMIEVEGYNDPVNFLIEQQYLAKVKFRTLNSESDLKIRAADQEKLTSSVDIPKHILDLLGNDSVRNIQILQEVERLIPRHKRIIVFAPSVENAHVLSAIVSARGYESSVVTAESGKGERDATIRRFRSTVPEPIVLVNYGVLTTGFDAPATSAAVIARPTKSLVLYSQMVGRATRGIRAGGNERAEIVTVIDPHLPGFGSVSDAFKNWEDVWNERSTNG